MRLVHSASFFALGLGALANLGILAVWLNVALEAPPGAAIRPMTEDALCALAALNALVIGVPLSLVAVCQRRWWVGVLALALNLVPWPLTDCVSDAVVAVMGYTLKE